MRRQESEPIFSGDVVAVNLKGLRLHSQSIPAHRGYTAHTMAWRKRLSQRLDVPVRVVRGGESLTLAYNDGYTVMVPAYMVVRA